jgi:hypothetical protein
VAFGNLDFVIVLLEIPEYEETHFTSKSTTLVQAHGFSNGSSCATGWFVVYVSVK